MADWTERLDKNLPAFDCGLRAAKDRLIATSRLHCMVKKLKKLMALPVLR